MRIQKLEAISQFAPKAGQRSITIWVGRLIAPYFNTLMRPSNFLIFVLALLSLTSCSRSLFTGEHRSLLFAEDAKKILVLDYTELSMSPPEDDALHYLDVSDLPFIHLYCINTRPDSLSRDCIMACNDDYPSAYVVTCHRADFEPGLPLAYISDAQSRVESAGVAGPVTGTNHNGTVSFDIYRAETGELVSSFEVTTRISGMIVKDKRGRGYKSINVTKAESALAKSRRKGLRNVLGRM